MFEICELPGVQKHTVVVAHLVPDMWLVVVLALLHLLATAGAGELQDAFDDVEAGIAHALLGLAHGRNALHLLLQPQVEASL